MVDAVRLIGQTKAVGDVDKRLDALEDYDVTGSLRNIGLFTGASTQTIDPVVTTVTTSGHTKLGLGACRYVYDVEITSNIVTANPLTMFMSKNGRGFKLAENIVNISMFGAIGDGVSNDTVAAQTAYNYVVSIGGGTLYISPGIFRVNLIANSRNVNVVGSNAQRSKLTPFDINLPALTLNMPDGSTAFTYFSDFSVERTDIAYDSSSMIVPSSLKGVGIQFGTTPYSIYTEYTGRVTLNRLRVRGFEKGVSRPWGSIMVTFDDCELRENFYHFHSVGKTTSSTPQSPNLGDGMHPGCIAVRGGVWIGCIGVCFYMEGSVVGTGQVTIDNVVIDTNPGYVFMFNSFHSTDGQPGLVVRQCWNEQNSDLNTRAGSGFRVTVGNAAPARPVWGLFRDAQGIKFVDTPVGSLELHNTVVVTDSCAMDRLTSYAPDAASALYHENAKAFAGRDTFGIFRTLAEPHEGDAGAPVAQWYRRPLITQANRGYARYSKMGFDGNTPISFTGENGFSTTDIVGQGVICTSTKTQRLQMTKTSLPIPVSVPAASYVVCIYTYRKLSGEPVSIGISGTEGITRYYPLASTEWETVVSMSRNKNAVGDMSIYHQVGSTPGDVEIGGISLAVFPNKQLALDYINAGVISLS